MRAVADVVCLQASRLELAGRDEKRMSAGIEVLMAIVTVVARDRWTVVGAAVAATPATAAR